MVHLLSYNRALQASEIKLKQSTNGPELQRYTYSYGEVNQSSSSVDTTKNNGQIGRIDGYINGAKQWDQRTSYDSLSRLSTAAEYRGDNGQQAWLVNYDFDRFGNRMQYQSNSNVAYTTVQPSDINTARNRFIESGATAITYDPAGNILTDAKFRGMNYNYDANGRQTFAEHTDHTNQQTSVYDCAGQRVQSSVNGTTRQTIYDIFGQAIADYTNGALERENIYRNGQLLITAAAPVLDAPSINVALASNGATASASSTLDDGRLPIAAINGDRKGIHWGSDPTTGSGWHDATNGVYPDWLQVNFNGSKTINEVDVFSVQDDVLNPVEPTSTLTFTQYGITDFSVQSWNGANWVDIPDCSVTGNNLVWRKLTLSNPVTTSAVRLQVTATPPGPYSYSRIVELEAWSGAASGSGGPPVMTYLFTDLQGSVRAVMNNNGLGKRLAPTLACAPARKATTFRILIVRSMRCLSATRPDWITPGGESMRAWRADGPVLIRCLGVLEIRKASIVIPTRKMIL